MSPPPWLLRWPGSRENATPLVRENDRSFAGSSARSRNRPVRNGRPHLLRRVGGEELMLPGEALHRAAVVREEDAALACCPFKDLGIRPPSEPSFLGGRDVEIASRRRRPLTICSSKFSSAKTLSTAPPDQVCAARSRMRRRSSWVGYRRSHSRSTRSASESLVAM